MISFYKRFFSALILLLTIGILPSCQIGRFIFYNFADIKDYKKFPSRPLQNDSVKYSFYHSEHERGPKTMAEKNKKPKSFETYLEASKTVAFIIVKNDTILYEHYFKGYDKTSIVPSFSMAKSVTSILIGCAIDDGLIKSVNEPVTNYIPELTKNGFEKVTIEHVLQMTSGLKFKESYINPFGDAASFYYGKNLRKHIRKMKLKKEPGKEFDYMSGNTEILGLILERALKNKTVTQYLQEKLWKPLGMEYDASWSLDKKKNGLEKTFCCINARALDFAKIGRLYRDKGNWNGKQIVSENWVRQSTKIDTANGSAWYYQYQWWLPTKNGDFMAEGILGQYVYVNPSNNVMIIRLGRKEGNIDWWTFLPYLASLYQKS